MSWHLVLTKMLYRLLQSADNARFPLNCHTNAGFETKLILYICICVIFIAAHFLPAILPRCVVVTIRDSQLRARILVTV